MKYVRETYDRKCEEPSNAVSHILGVKDEKPDKNAKA